MEENNELSDEISSIKEKNSILNNENRDLEAKKNNYKQIVETNEEKVVV